MGSGRAKTVTIHADKMYMEEPFRTHYNLGLGLNLILRERTFNIPAETVHLSYDEEDITREIGDLHIYVNYPTVHEKQDYYSGDRIIGYSSYGRISDKQWKKIYVALGGEYFLNPDELDNSLRPILETQNRYDISRSAVFSQSPEEDIEPLLQAMETPYPMDAETVITALQNIQKGKSPYSLNPLAVGSPIYDPNNSPTMIDNRRVNQNILHSIRNFKKLNDVFHETYEESVIDSLYYGDDLYLSSKKDTVLGYYQTRGKEVHMGKQVMAPYQSYNTFWGMSSIGAQYLDTLTHEFAHALHDTLQQKYEYEKYIKGLDNDFTRKYEKHIPIAYDYRFYGAMEPETSLQAVSPYGNTDKAEAFAEAFTLYTMGEKPTMGKKYYGMFKEYMKDMGLEKYYAINRYHSVPAEPLRPVATPKTVKARTLPSKPISDATPQSVIFNMGGTEYKIRISKTAKKKGYTVKRINGKDYFIDINTGALLKIRTGKK